MNDRTHQAAPPPPQDESWWEAVMAEEEERSTSHPARKPATAMPGLRPNTPRQYPGAAQYPGPGHYSGPGQHSGAGQYSPAGQYPGAGHYSGAGQYSPAGQYPGPNHYPGANQYSGAHLAADSPEVDWLKAMQLYQTDQTVTLLVTSYNRGGLLVGGEGLHGFVPISHLVEAPLETLEPDSWLVNYLEHTLRLKIIECDPERGRVVFSERAALAEPGVRNALLQRLHSGDCVPGAVTNITDFGVFVDLGGVEGLVHVSEISWGRVHHPADVLTVGQQVQVYIIQVDRERARIALSLKRLYPNPWETAEARYFPGQITEAVVTSIVPFGAFARLEEGLDGLIHISEMSCADTGSARSELLQEGQHVMVRVLHVDGARQRLGLSLNVNQPG